VPASKGGSAAKGDAMVVEEIDLQSLLAPYMVTAGGSFGPPWLKEGWFHAYLLQASTMGDATARQAADQLFHRLVTGAYEGPAERADLARRLVGRLGAGCERAVVGYSVRREPFNAEFSQGIENIAWDSQAGFDSEIFVRTAKLKDFPWNGWMRVEPGRGLHRPGRATALGRARRPRVPARALRRGPGPASGGAGLGGGGRRGGRGDSRGRAAPGAG